MGLTLWFLLIPTPRRPDYPDHRLPAGVHVHVLNGHLLLALAAGLPKGDEEAAARAGKLARSALETYAGRPEGTSVQ